MTHKKAIEMLGELPDWYVLLYNVLTGDYENEIVTMPYAEAKALFDKTDPPSENVRVELIFSPQETPANENESKFIKRYGFDNAIVEMKYIASGAAVCA